MVSRSLTASLFVLSISSPFLNALSTSVPTTCYVLNGTHTSTAGFRCNNATTGHSSCCAPGAICYSNGVCQQSNGNVQDYLRVGCTDKTWQDSSCLDQCTTFRPDSSAGIRFCDGAITATNQYCCDNGTSGVGSFACCGTPSSLFAINPIASVLAQMPLSQLSLTSTISSTSTSSTSPAAQTTSATASPTPSSSGSSNNATAIGVGVGVPVGGLSLAGIAYLLWRRRRNKQRQQPIGSVDSGDSAVGMSATPANGYRDEAGPQEVPAGAIDSNAGKKGYFGDQQYEPAPQELPNTEREEVHEIGG